MIKYIAILFEKLLMKYGLVLTSTMPHLNRERLFDISERGWQYIRYSSLELVAHEMKNSKKEGSVAEVGVYRGTFAKYINLAFPDRTFYLFDTFEGFHPDDIIVEKEKGFRSGKQDFSDTSVEKVLSRMKYPEKCIVKKGVFPKTTKGIRDNFVFVSLDADLYQPTYAGLNFFYPRLVPGGVIFVHDYNNYNYKGPKKAVREFCSEQNISYFPLTDKCGTAVIIK